MKLNNHPTHTRLLNRWRYYRDQYDGGPDYCEKTNPLAITIPQIAGQSGNVGASKYLIQQGLESARNYAIRLNETPAIPICSQVVDFYASTVGSQENATLDAGESLSVFLDDADLQGQSLTQFMHQCRVDAAVYGHTFVVVDMLRADGEILTQADVQRAGLRPYVYEIAPDRLINWRFGANGVLLEAIYQVPKPDAAGILDEGRADDSQAEYLYWSESEWARLRTDGNALTQIGGGLNALGAVPVVCLYHKRLAAFEGESLVSHAAHMQHTAINWLSDMLQNLRMTMYAQPVLKSDRNLDQVAVGAAALMQLSPQDNEDFAFVTPDASPFAEAWKAWYEFCDMARATMGLKRATTDAAVESGVSKAWDYHEATKIMARMALNEQEAVKQILYLADRWQGREFSSSVLYSTTFDLSAAEDDIQTAIALQAAQAPTSAIREVMRRGIMKLLPSLPPETQNVIQSELDTWRTAQAPVIP